MIMLNKPILLFNLFLLSSLLFSLQAQDITKDEVVAYFNGEIICNNNDPLDVPEISLIMMKLDSLQQILVNLQKEADFAPEEKLKALEPKYQANINKYNELQGKLYDANMKHCKESIAQSGLNLTWERFLYLKEMSEKNDNEKLLALQDEILINEFNTRISASEPMIEGMDDETFQHHLKYYVIYNRKSEVIQKAEEAAIRGEGSERDFYKMYTELTDYIQSLFADGTINEEYFKLLDQKVENDFLLYKFIEVLISGRIGFTE